VLALSVHTIPRHCAACSVRPSSHACLHSAHTHNSAALFSLSCTPSSHACLHSACTQFRGTVQLVLYDPPPMHARTQHARMSMALLSLFCTTLLPCMLVFSTHTHVQGAVKLVLYDPPPMRACTQHTHNSAALYSLFCTTLLPCMLVFNTHTHTHTHVHGAVTLVLYDPSPMHACTQRTHVQCDPSPIHAGQLQCKFHGANKVRTCVPFLICVLIHYMRTTVLRLVVLRVIK